MKRRSNQFVLVEEVCVVGVGEILFDRRLAFRVCVWLLTSLFVELLQNVKQTDTLLLFQLLFLVEFVLGAKVFLFLIGIFKWSANWTVPWFPRLEVGLIGLTFRSLHFLSELVLVVLIKVVPIKHGIEFTIILRFLNVLLLTHS